MMVLQGYFWYRESTQEWIFEVEFEFEDIFSTQRFPGKTKLDALQKFQANYSHQYLSDHIPILHQSRAIKND